MKTKSEKKPNLTPKRIWKEIFIAFAVIIVFILISVGLAASFPWFNSFLLGIVTLFFVFVARWFMNKDKEPDRFHVHSQNLLRDAGIGVALSVIIFPLYALSFWFWSTQVSEKTFDFDLDHYREWPAEFEGTPNRDLTQPPGIYLSGSRNNIKATFQTDPKKFASKLVVHSKTPFQPNFENLNATDISQKGTDWEFTFQKDVNRGYLVIPNVETVDAEVVSTKKGSFNLPLYVGPNASLTTESHISLQRGYFWLVMWLLTQILLVALGEETFYRGYLQERIRDALKLRAMTEKKFTFLGADSVTWQAIFLTSVFFAVGHLVIPIHGLFPIDRLAVFFPSLLFGLLKFRTKGVVTPIVFHGLCNMMVVICSVHFF